MKIKNGKDFWAGLMFMGFGLAFWAVASPPKLLVDLLTGSFGASTWGYPMGSAVRMGPAYFPAVLGGMLAVLGAMVFFRAFASSIQNPLKVFTFRPAVFIAAVVVGTIAFFSADGLKDYQTVQNLIVGIALVLFFGAFGPRALFVVLLAVVAYGYLLKPLGIVLATVVLVVMSALGGHDFRKKEIVILTVVMVLFAVFVFVKGLGLPFNIWPGE